MRAVRAVRAVVRYARYARRDRSAGYARRHRRTGHPRRDRHERETENQSELCERGREGEERWNFLIAHSCEIKKVIDKKLKARRRSRTCAHGTEFNENCPYSNRCTNHDFQIWRLGNLRGASRLGTPRRFRAPRASGASGPRPTLLGLVPRPLSGLARRLGMRGEPLRNASGRSRS